MKKKVCSKCKLKKTLSEFHKNIKLKDGLCCRCKLCIKEYQLQNKTQILNKKKEYRINNQDKIIAHRELYKKRGSILNKKWQKANKEKRNFQQKERLKTDIHFKLARNLRGRVRSAILGNIKTENTLNLVGCSIEQLRGYLEKQFTKGMSWKNYGYHGWHIDHIRPCTSFNLSNPQQQKQCFHYTNLQPLWAKDNLRKNNKVNWSRNK
jgi:hypothetical protein